MDSVQCTLLLLTSALDKICPDYSKYCSGTVKINPNPNGPEVECKTVEQIFWKAYRDQKQSVDKNSKKKVIQIVSDHGLTRVVTLTEFGQLVVEHLDSEIINKYFAYAAINPKCNASRIYTTTKKAAEHLKLNGFVICHSCGKYVRDAGSGMEWHMKNMHQISNHEHAYEAARAANQSLSNFVQGSVTDGMPQLRKRGKMDKMDALNSKKDSITRDSLLAEGSVHSLLHPGLEACRVGDLMELKNQVENKHWDPTRCFDKHGSTALLWAAGGGHLDCCKYLVTHCQLKPIQPAQKGARRGFAGRTALHWAARNGHIDVVSWLINDCSCDPDVETSDGTTPFCLAAYQGQVKVCQFLVQVGANPHIINHYGCNATMWAAQGCEQEHGLPMLKYLQTLGVEFNRLNDNGQGCLHKAAQRGRKDVAEWLLDVAKIDGAIHFVPNADEKSTPVELAYYGGFHDFSKWLEDKVNGDICI